MLENIWQLFHSISCFKHPSIFIRCYIRFLSSFDQTGKDFFWVCQPRPAHFPLLCWFKKKKKKFFLKEMWSLPAWGRQKVSTLNPAVCGFQHQHATAQSPECVRQSGQVCNSAADRCADHIQRLERGTLKRFHNLVVVRLPVSAFPPTLVFPKPKICSLFLLFLRFCNFSKPRIACAVWLWAIRSVWQIFSLF